MNSESALQGISPMARAEASAWLAKLHGPERSAGLERDFQHWLQADPEHARAFEHVTDIWDGIGRVHIGGLPRVAAVGAPHRRQPTWRFVAVSGAFAAIVLGAWLMLFDTRSYATQIGEQRSVALNDGSRLYLNSESRVTVDLEDDVRRVDLVQGEAFFEVARDATRPFLVTAGDRVVTALGTSFVVRLEREQVAVTLVEGKVSVAAISPSRPTPDTQARVRQDAPAPDPAAAIVLDPGERMIVATGGVPRIDTPRPDATAAWRRGEIVLDSTPLADAAAELNRHQRQKLVLADAQLGMLPVSGIYRIGSNADFAEAVALVYGLDVVMNGDQIMLKKNHGD